MALGILETFTVLVNSFALCPEWNSGCLVMRELVWVYYMQFSCISQILIVFHRKATVFKVVEVSSHFQAFSTNSSRWMNSQFLLNLTLLRMRMCC